MLIVLGLLHRVNISDIYAVSEVHTTSVFSFEVSKLVDFCGGHLSEANNIGYFF
jgi:hypothetical protein